MTRKHAIFGFSLALVSAAALAQGNRPNVPSPMTPSNSPALPSMLPVNPTPTPTRPSHPTTPQAAGSAGANANFGKLDANADKILTKTEVKGDAALSARFSQLDANADGKLSSDEFDRFSAKGGNSTGLLVGKVSGKGRATVDFAAFEGLDLNADGKLNRTEANSDTTLKVRFKSKDKNRDGTIDEAEFKASGSAPPAP